MLVGRYDNTPMGRGGLWYVGQVLPESHLGRLGLKRGVSGIGVQPNLSQRGMYHLILRRN